MSEPTEDSRQIERTNLSWNRTLLGLVGVGLLALRAGLQLGGAIAAGGVVFLAVAVGLAVRVRIVRRRGQSSATVVSGSVPPRTTIVLTGVVLAAGLVAVAAAVLDLAAAT